MISIHGHEVLNMMLESDTGYREKSLEQAIMAVMAAAITATIINFVRRGSPALCQ